MKYKIDTIVKNVFNMFGKYISEEELFDLLKVIKQPSMDTANKPTKERSKPDVLTPIPRPSETLGQKLWKRLTDAF